MGRFRGPNEVFGCATNLPAPPTDADSSVRLRATGSDTPWLVTGFADVLPQSTAGSNSAARLEVVFLRGLFSSRTGFFEGLCETLRDSNQLIFSHRAVKAGVLYKWEHYARPKFFLLLGPPAPRGSG